MANVYRARDTTLGREVAVKVLFPHLCKRREVVARFQREARAVAALDHPNILRIHDVGGGGGEPDDRGELDPPYIVLELVRGGSLREHMVKGEPVLGEVVACAGASLCSALAVAHAAGIIHRDIKPANIMIAEGGRLVLADFGVARVEDEDTSLVTKTGALLGTPAFMSPEQARGDELDARSDLYSLGATLYQLATGSMPFAGPTPKVMFAIARGELTPPLRRNPAMGHELARAIERMMAAEPADRYPDAAAARADLLAIAERGGAGDEADELAAYVADPAGHTARRTPEVVAATLARARAAADARQLPAAMALTDRVLALDPDNADAGRLIDQLGRRAGRARLAAYTAAAVGVAAIAAAAIAWWPSPAGSGPAAVADAGAVDAVGPDAAPPDARRAPDAAVADAAGKSVASGSHTGTGWPDPGHRRRRDAAPAPPPPPDAAVVPVAAPPDARPAPARVTLVMNAWCDVTIDGRSHGRASRDRAIELDPGRHQIVCSQGRGMPEWRTEVTLRAGEQRTLRGEVLGRVRVTVSVSGGDGVDLGGRYRANGASFELAPNRYRITVVQGGRRLASKWVDLPRVQACVVRDKPAIACYPPKP